MNNQVLKKEPYGNFRIYSPDGMLLCCVAKRRMDWYLKKKLADRIDDSSVRLNFFPKISEFDDYNVTSKESICVVCGTTENLTRHHCVPYQYRKYFPEKMKANKSHDILLLCLECHATYEEKHAVILNEELSRKHKVPVNGIGFYDEEKSRYEHCSCSLAIHGDSMPKERIAELMGRLSVIIGRQATWDDVTQGFLDSFVIPKDSEEWNLNKNQLLSASHEDKHNEFRKFKKRFLNYFHSHRHWKCVTTHGRLVVDSVGEENIGEFIKMWRKHFLDSMNPQFMPSKWDLNYSIKEK